MPLSELFESIMLICFGCAWPLSIYRSWSSRSNGGKSLYFLIVILLGYFAGIAHKLLSGRDIVIWLYCLNALMVLVDILLYWRNARYGSVR